VVAHRLRLDYNALKKRMGGVPSPHQERVPGKVSGVDRCDERSGRDIHPRVRDFSSSADAGAVEGYSRAGLGALLRAWREVAG
jgi:hypothetical protein